MEKYPEYLFLQTQPQLYDFLKEDYPDVYEHIKERVKEGKWEPAGAMWVGVRLQHRFRRIHHPPDSGGKKFLPERI